MLKKKYQLMSKDTNKIKKLRQITGAGFKDCSTSKRY